MPLRRMLPLVIGGAVAAAPLAPAPAPDWDQAQRVDIELSNFAFTPNRLMLHGGRPYRLHLTNKGSGGHNFSAPAFFKAATIAPEDVQLIEEGAIELGKGESRDVRLIPASGHYKLKCTHFLHSGFGMKGRILVE